MSTLPTAEKRNLEEYGVMKAQPGISWSERQEDVFARTRLCAKFSDPLIDSALFDRVTTSEERHAGNVSALS